MCCAMRDKDAFGDNSYGLGRVPQFSCVEAEATLLEQACFLSYSPLHQPEAAKPRRLAVASMSEVRVYRLPQMDLVPGQTPQLSLTHRLKLEEDRKVVAMIFCDEDNSRNVAVASSPISPGSSGEHLVRVFSCDMSSAPSGSTGEAPWPVVDWQPDKGCLATLDGHGAEIVKLAFNRLYLLSADAAGECSVWQKSSWQRNKPFQRRSVVHCHAGGISDLTADRIFAYTAGREENRICVWLLPDMSQVLSVPIDLPEDLLAGLPPAPVSPTPTATPCQGDSGGLSVAPAAAAGGLSLPVAPAAVGLPIVPASRLARVNLVRRPLSRWAGSLGSSRGSQRVVKTPRGCLFVAAILREGCEIAGAGAGLLLEWTLSERPTLHGAIVAHDSPIVNLVYGPYDNGPLITADAYGVFRIWDFTLNCGMQLSQQIAIQSPCPQPTPGSPLHGAGMLAIPGCPVIALEPPKAVYSVVGGRLFVWQRQPEGSAPVITIAGLTTTEGGLPGVGHSG